MSEKQPADARRGSSRQFYILWGLVLGGIILVALFCAFFVGPVIQTRRVVARHEAGTIGAEEAVKALGGKERAAGRLTLYLRLPPQLFPHRREAVSLLTGCGRAALPGLILALESEDSYSRWEVTWALRELGPAAAPAVPAMARALAEDDSGLRQQHDVAAR